MAISDRKEIHLKNRVELVTAGEELEAFARSLGAEIYGVASAEAFKEFPQKPQPSKFVPDAKSVVIVGMPFTREIYATVAKPELAEIFRIFLLTQTVGINPNVQLLFSYCKELAIDLRVV